MTTTAPIVHATERRERGLALYREIMATEPPELTTPRAAALIDFVFAEIWSRPVLTRRERRLIALACAAGANAHITVGQHLYAALKTGEFSLDELDEFVLHFAVYCGWPMAEVLETILDEQLTRLTAEGYRHSRLTPQPLSTAPADQELRKQGGEQEFLDVNHHQPPPRGFPYYEDGILTFVFGEMWKRPGLSRRDRRWITLATVGLDDTVGPIQSHVYSAMNTGDISHDEMQEMVLQFAAHSGWPKAAYMQVCVNEMHQRITSEADAQP